MDEVDEDEDEDEDEVDERSVELLTEREFEESEGIVEEVGIVNNLLDSSVDS